LTASGAIYFQVQDEISRRVAYSLTRQLNKAELPGKGGV
jgi:hypothetical protein